jgi:branched-chain amino acid transport system substrate-binding protein
LCIRAGRRVTSDDTNFQLTHSSGDHDETLRNKRRRRNGTVTGMRRRVENDLTRAGRSPFGGFAVVVALGIASAACSGDDSSGPPPTIATTTTLAPPLRVDDGSLVIGALIPTDDATIGASMTESFTAEIDNINEAGGVLGRPVEAIVADEGASPASAARAIDDLVTAGVDAIVGPTSSNTAIAALDRAVRAGIVACSPTASAIALDEYPDDSLFFRTIATDTLQARAIAQQAQQTGATDVVIAHIDDAYGRPYAQAIETDVGAFAEVATVAVAVGDTDLTGEVSTLLEDDPQVAIVIGSGDATARFLEALGNRDFTGLTDIFVNDAARNSRALLAQLPMRLRERLRVVAPRIVADATEPGSPVAPFDAQVRNCVNLISVSALQAQSDSPLLIASQMSSVSAGGQVCTSFQTCAELLEDGLQINYDGTEGMIDLGRNGDPDRATFDLFELAESGADVLIPGRSVSVVAA